METILADIARAFNSKAYYAALATALTLPELCGRCEQRDIKQSKGVASAINVFVRWTNNYLPDYYLDGRELYYLRNGISHHGRGSNPSTPNLRYMFYLPEATGLIHGVKVIGYGPDAIKTLSLELFLADMTNATRRWASAHSNDDRIMDNLGAIIQPRVIRSPAIFSGQTVLW